MLDFFDRRLAKVLDAGSAEWVNVGADQIITPGLGIQTNDDAQVESRWRVKSDDAYDPFGRDGKFLEVECKNIQDVERKTLAVKDKVPELSGGMLHWLVVAKSATATTANLSIAVGAEEGPYVVLSKKHVAIRNRPTPFYISLPASDIIAEFGEGPLRYRLNTTFPGGDHLSLQILDIRFCQLPL